MRPTAVSPTARATIVQDSVDENLLFPELFVDCRDGTWRQYVGDALVIVEPTSTGVHDEVVPVADERDEGVDLVPVLVRHDGEERVADPQQAGNLKQDALKEHGDGLDLVQVWGDVEDVLKAFTAARQYLHRRGRLEADVRPQQQLVWAIRLVVVPLNVQSAHHFARWLIARVAGLKNDLNVRVELPQRLHDLLAGHARHEEVQQHQVNVLAPQTSLQRFRAIARRHDFVPFVLKQYLRCLHVLGTVVDQQDRSSRGNESSAGGSSGAVPRGKVHA